MTLPSGAASSGGSVELFSARLVRRMIPIVVLCVLVYGAMLAYGDADVIANNLGQIPFSIWVGGVLLSLGSQVFRALRWQYYLHRAKIRVPVVDGVLVFVAGFAMSITPAKLGEVLKSLLLKEAWDVPVARSAPLVVAERVTDVGGLLLLGACGLLTVPNGVIPALFAFLATLALFLLSAWRKLGLWLIALLCKVRFIARLEDKLTRAYLELVDALSLRAFCVGLLFSFLGWGLQCWCVTFVAPAFASEVPLGAALIGYSAPLLAGTLAFLPGGLGLTEASMTSALQELSGLEANAAVCVTILVRVLTFWLAIVLGFLALWAYRRLVASRRRTSPAIVG